MCGSWGPHVGRVPVCIMSHCGETCSCSSWRTSGWPCVCASCRTDGTLCGVGMLGPHACYRLVISAVGVRILTYKSVLVALCYLSCTGWPVRVSRPPCRMLQCMRMSSRSSEDLFRCSFRREEDLDSFSKQLLIDLGVASEDNRK